MIRIEITGENPQEAFASLGELVQLMSTAGGTPAQIAQIQAQEPPVEQKRGRGRPPKETPATVETPAEPASETEQPAPAASDITRESVQKRCVQYGQPGKGGPAALKELLVEVGAPNGKWSEISDEMLPALNARLDDLLA